MSWAHLNDPTHLSFPKIRSGLDSRREARIIASSGAMLAILHSLGMFVADLFKPRSRLEAENLFLRHQLSIALRSALPRLRLRGVDRALLVWMTRLWPSLLGAMGPGTGGGVGPHVSQGMGLHEGQGVSRKASDCPSKDPTPAICPTLLIAKACESSQPRPLDASSVLRSVTALWDRFNGGADGTRWYYGELSSFFARTIPGGLSDRLSRAV